MPSKKVYSDPIVEDSNCQGGRTIAESLDCFGLFDDDIEVDEEQHQQQVFQQRQRHYQPEKGLSQRELSLANRDSLAIEAMMENSTVSPSVTRSEVIPADDYSLVKMQPRSHDDDHHQRDGNRRRRNRLRGILVLTLLLAIVLATVLTRNNRKENGRGSEPNVISKGEQDLDAGDNTTDTTSTMAPSTAPTSSLELTLEYQVLKPYVDTALLLDPETPQGKAFLQVMAEGITTYELGFRIKQRFAMMVLYFSMGGPDWVWNTGWRTFEEEESDWFGVAITRFRNGNRIVAALQLPSNNLVGEIPNEICLLSSLEMIQLENNAIVGELPSCLTNLTSLFELDVHNNNLSGNPPMGFLEMPELETLSLSDNAFSGNLDFLQVPETLVADIFVTNKVTHLHLDNNPFTGEIPSSLYYLEGLEELTLHNTDLTGDVTAICEGDSAVLVTSDCNEVVCEDAECCECFE